MLPVPYWQAPATQEAPDGQTLPQRPQWAASVRRLRSQPSPAAALQSAKPVVQAKPQAVPVQVAVELGGTAQGVQAVPHEAVAVLDRQVVPHAWKPVAQAKPQAPAVQVARPLAGTGQLVGQLPQWRGSVAVFAHSAPHSVGVVPPQPEAQRCVGGVPEAVHAGAVVGHTVEQPPQCAGTVTSTSQPVPGSSSQFA
jgi:hypothetical protein